MWCGAPGCDVDARALEAHLLTQLARFKVPREYVFVDALPRNAMGKVQHFVLRRRRRRCQHGDAHLKIAVLGGGNGSFAAAGDFALAGHDVRLWRRDAAAVAAHRAAGGAHRRQGFSRAARGAAGAGHDRHRRGRARRRTDPVPCARDRAARHRARARAASADGQVVFLPPGTFGSLIFAKAAHDAGNRADAAFAETGTLPWLTRKHGPFEVAITIRAKRLPTGVFPLRLKDHALDVIGRAFPGVIETAATRCPAR